MSGTLAGGRKAAKTNKMRHGDDFYKRIGSKGGSHSCNGGFASDKVGKDGLTGRERARLVGAEGGRKSIRGSSYETLAKLRENHTTIVEMLRRGETIREISRATGIPVNTLSRRREPIARAPRTKAAHNGRLCAKGENTTGSCKLQRTDLHRRPRGYEPRGLLLPHSALSVT